jgi:3'(2'), 5'-bisphosphate nucleotidase
MESTDKISFNISEFVSIILQYYSFIDQYGKKIKEKKIENKEFTKEENEKFTEFDYLAQKLLVDIINKHYPYKNFTIVGEESLNEENDKNILDPNNEDKCNLLSSIDKIALDGKFKLPRDFDKTIDVTNSEICIFIDPIDGTKSLIKKNYKPVTSLFGLCINNQPFIGFIHYVFSNDNTTYFNFPSHGIYEYSPKEHSFLRIHINTDDEKFNFIISSSRASDQMIKFIKTFKKSKIEKDSGLGNKVVKCILEDKIYFTSGKNSCGLWDICAASCLLNELGTDVYCFNGEKIKYVPKKILFEHNGVVCVSKNKLNTFLEHVKKYYSENI